MARIDLPALRVVSPQPALPQPYLQPALSLAQVAAIVRAHWKRALAIVAGVTALALATSLCLPKTYTATATLMVDYDVTDPLGGKEFPAGLLGNYMATQVELLSSPELLIQVVDRLGLTRIPRYAAGHDGDAATLRDWVQAKVAKRLTVEQGRFGSQLLYVRYSAPSPKEAAEVANAVAQIYSEQVFQRLTRPATERADRYRNELDALKQDVASAQQKVTEFRKRAGLVDIDARVDTELGQLVSLQEKLLAAQHDRRQAEAALAANPSVGQPVLSSSLIQQLKTQLAGEQAKMAQLRAVLGPKHPDVVELASRIAQTQASLGAQLSTYSDGAASELVAARDLESKLSKAVETQRAAVLESHRLQDEGQKYLLELESAQSVYKHALEGYDRITFAGSGRYTNVSFVSHATPPLKPTKPRVLRNTALGAMLGMLLGLCGPLGFELLHRRVRCRDDLERDHGIPVLIEFDALPAHRSPA
ncbi:MAG TPA: Wzz/FepE/Etk N-terminal domain-containing protein [Nevskiaceae bacterium]|nr:Wzz/FepE/Etk N-terminal domain-containing protein [Nevskiaceae bacterium]